MTTPTGIDRDAPVIARHETDIGAPLQTVWRLQTDVNNWPACTLSRLICAPLPSSWLAVLTRANARYVPWDVVAFEEVFGGPAAASPPPRGTSARWAA